LLPPHPGLPANKQFVDGIIEMEKIRNFELIHVSPKKIVPENLTRDL